MRTVVYLQTERKVVPGAIHQDCRADVKVADVGRFVEVSIGAVAVALAMRIVAEMTAVHPDSRVPSQVSRLVVM